MAKPKSLSLSVKTIKPVPVLLKPVKLDYPKFFKALLSGAKNLALHDWTKVTSDALDMAVAINLTTKPDELAYTLLQRSITEALFAVVGENNLRTLVETTKEAKTAQSLVEETLGVGTVELDKSFFDRPKDLAIITSLQGTLKTWLVAYGLNEAGAENISQRLPSYFQASVMKEWRRNSGSYKAILEALQSPFSKASDRELGWKNYDAYLQQQIQESIFDEPFSLSQIYIPLNAYYREKAKDNLKGRSLKQAAEKKPVRCIVSLEQELMTWLSKPKKEDLLRVISGGPGSGKSSFARIFAAKVSALGQTRVVFIPLHLIDADKALDVEINRFARDEGFLNFDPLDSESPEPDLLVVLDGLDELASQGRAAADSARSFVNEVDRLLRRKNTQTIRLRILLSGRELVVQENETELRGWHPTLNLLPYRITEEERTQNKKTDRDPHGLLDHDLRQDWWSNYGQLIGDPQLLDLPQALQKPGLDDVTAQPLLNYLVALSYTRGKVKFDDTVNLNAVYGDLVEAVYERGYDQKRRHRDIRHMNFAEFQRVLEEVALAAWHGDGRTTTIREIEDHCNASSLKPLLDKFQEGAAAGVTRLLAAFFFRQHGQRVASGDRTFVFTHKSFGEYLTALRIVRAAERVVKQLGERKNSLEEGWDEREALAHWAGICGPAPCTLYLRDFIRGEFASRDLVQVDQCRVVLAELFTHLLAHGMPMEKVEIIENGQKSTGLGSFPKALAQSRNAEETLLVALNATAIATKTLADIPFAETDNTVFGTWLRRIQQQRFIGETTLALSCLSFLRLNVATLHNADLSGADFSNSELLHLSALFASCWNVSFQNAELSEANFLYGVLLGALFQGANLQGADFQGVNLRGANFQGANLSGVNFLGANLYRANFLGANLEKANLQEADLTDSILAGTNLQEANFMAACLVGAKLNSANLCKTDLQEADLRRADLQGAHLQQANLRNANLHRANLKEADTTGADLQGTILEDK